MLLRPLHMKKHQSNQNNFALVLFLNLVSAVIVFSGLTPTVYAFEVNRYDIKGAVYEITVGSLVEPVVIGKPNAMQFMITRNGQPYVLPEGSLQSIFEVGWNKTTLSLSSTAAGTYYSAYIPQETGQMTYHLVGNLDSVPFTDSYVCSDYPSADTSTDGVVNIQVLDSVLKTYRKGIFTCPLYESEAVADTPASSPDSDTPNSTIALVVTYFFGRDAAKAVSENSLWVLIFPFAGIIMSVMYGVFNARRKTAKPVVKE